MYKLYSTYFLENDVEQYNCYVNDTLWKRITNDLMANRIIIRINHTSHFWLCSLGQPIYTTFDSTNHIYLPKWMIDQLNCEGVGESVTLDWFPSDVFDFSKKITLQPHTDISYIDNIQDVLSCELTKLAVLKKDSTIEVCMLGVDTLFKFNVVGLEPANIVLCEGDEVTLDFDYSLTTPTPSTSRSTVHSTARPPSPYPPEATPTVLYNDVQPSEANILGGVQREANILGGVQRDSKYNPWRIKGFMPKSS